MNIVELFAGIGSQRKAISRLNINHKVLNISEWYIAAILAYDSIHNGKRDIDSIKELSRTDLVTYLSQFTFSSNGKSPIDRKNISRLSENLLRHLYIANIRTNNLVSVDKVSPTDLPSGIDVLTYSFPCQDLSNVGAFHGYRNGIDRGVPSRSGLLWEVERLLQGRFNLNLDLPRVLLMENVSTLLSKRHRDNFQEWQKNLEVMGYINKHYVLNSKDFGIPQNRSRIFMISVHVSDLNKGDISRIKSILNRDFSESHMEMNKLELYLRTEYKGRYLEEADEAQPNDTISRREIFDHNYYLFGDERENVKFCRTITTRQDRHPNSGVIQYKTNRNNYRFLTAREVFLLMGFDENDYDQIINDNFMKDISHQYFTRDKFYVLAGNSIVVNVLEAVFSRIQEVIQFLEHK